MFICVYGYFLGLVVETTILFVSLLSLLGFVGSVVVTWLQRFAGDYSWAFGCFVVICVCDLLFVCALVLFVFANVC